MHSSIHVPRVGISGGFFFFLLTQTKLMEISTVRCPGTHKTRDLRIASKLGTPSAQPSVACGPWKNMTSTDLKSHRVRCPTAVTPFAGCAATSPRGLLGESNVSSEPSVETFTDFSHLCVQLLLPATGSTKAATFFSVCAKSTLPALEIEVSFALSVLDFSAACQPFHIVLKRLLEPAKLTWAWALPIKSISAS